MQYIIIFIAELKSYIYAESLCIILHNISFCYDGVVHTNRTNEFLAVIS